MTTAEFVTKELCEAHRENNTAKHADLDTRVDTLSTKIDQILTLQTATYHAIIYLAGGIIVILIGVILGRGFDLGLLIPK